jgi:hypothetical protein
MDVIWTAEIDSILKIGFSLEELGVRNWALKRDDALQALVQLSSMRIAVLGGDVYMALGDSIEPKYDNWYCNPEPTESDEDFIVRSVTMAKNYITNYPSPQNLLLFTLVPRV